MKSTIFQLAVLSVAAIAAGTCLSTRALAQSDEAFAKDAASGGMAEVKLGELAQEKGASSTVKEFGKRMETDHSKADDRLKSVASKDNISLPSDMSAKDRATYDRLSKLSGTEFDRAYALDMVKDHESDVAAFKKEAANGTNADMKQFASETLPTLEDHLKLARDMEKNTTGTTSSANY